MKFIFHSADNIHNVRLKAEEPHIEDTLFYVGFSYEMINSYIIADC